MIQCSICGQPRDDAAGISCACPRQPAPLPASKADKEQPDGWDVTFRFFDAFANLAMRLFMAWLVGSLLVWLIEIPLWAGMISSQLAWFAIDSTNTKSKP